MVGKRGRRGRDDVGSARGNSSGSLQHKRPIAKRRKRARRTIRQERWAPRPERHSTREDRYRTECGSPDAQNERSKVFSALRVVGVVAAVGGIGSIVVGIAIWEYGGRRDLEDLKESVDEIRLEAKEARKESVAKAESLQDDVDDVKETLGKLELLLTLRMMQQTPGKRIRVKAKRQGAVPGTPSGRDRKLRALVKELTTRVKSLEKKMRRRPRGWLPRAR